MESTTKMLVYGTIPGVWRGIKEWMMALYGVLAASAPGT